MAGHSQIWLRILLFYLTLGVSLRPQAYSSANKLLYDKKEYRFSLGRSNFSGWNLTFRIQLNRIEADSNKNISRAVFRTTKHGYVLLALPDRLFWIDLTICVDVQRNPGPFNLESCTWSDQQPLRGSNTNVLPKYSGNELQRLRTTNICSSQELLLELKSTGTYHTLRRQANGCSSISSFIPVLESTRRSRKHDMAIIDKYNDRLIEHRNYSNLIPVKRLVSKSKCNIKFGIWNAHSVNKKSGPICDLVISKHLDILAFTETWLSGNSHKNHTIAETLNTLQDFEFYDVPRPNRTGGGVGVLLRKGFTVKRKAGPLFTSMELLDLEISHGSSLIRLITIYRPPRSKKTLQHSRTSSRIFQLCLKHSHLHPVTYC